MALVAACWLSVAGTVQAATITVTTTADPAGAGACADGPPAPCSLRQAVAFASAGDTIELGAATYTLTQGNALLVTRSLTIDGTGSGATKIDGTQNRDGSGRPDRILKATAGSLQIRELTFTGGTDGRDENFTTCSPCDTHTANGGGALFNSGATVSLDRVVFDANTGSPLGGAVANGASGTLTLTDVDFRSNGAAYGAGLFSRSGAVTATRVSFRDATGVFGAGAVYLRGGTMSLTNSTAVGNGSPSSIGGGIINQGGTLSLLNVTLADNLRGGLETDVGASTTVQNTILGTGFSDGQNGSCAASGRTSTSRGGFTTARAVTTDLGNNIDQDGTCALTGPGDQSLVDPRLAPAGDNGGETPTAALLHGSAALDAGNDTACLEFDQRGIARLPQGAHCDVGAFEAVRVGPPSATTAAPAEIGAYDATLAATLNLAGEAGGLRFEYGTAPTALTETTTVIAAGVLSSPTTKTQSLQGLSPGATYYYRAVAENATGAATGAVLQLTTNPGVPGVSAVQVESVTDTTATIDFAIDPAGAETTYVITYESDDHAGQTASVPIGATPGYQQLTYTLTGLKPGTEYGFDVVATNSQGTTSTDGAPLPFTTHVQVTSTAGSPVTLTDTGNTFVCPSAVIDWGDGTPEDEGGTVACSDDGHDGYDYSLTADHTYAAAGRFHIQIQYSTQDRSDAWAEIAPAPQQRTLLGTTVTLAATPGAGAGFIGWGGACSGTGGCAVALDSDAAVTATFAARSVTPGPTPTPTPAPTPTAVPPVFHQTVAVAPVSGKVLIKLKGTKKFVALEAGRTIPLGAQIDVTKGKIALTSVPKAGGIPETATFYDGIFTVTQQGSITQLTLSGPAPQCGARGKASTAAAKVKKRRLWGDGKGQFRTKGKYAAATVRGTRWLVEDSCAGTLVRVEVGVVSVRDDVLRKMVTVRAGKRYTARPKRR